MSENKRFPSVLNRYEQLALLKQPNPKAPTGLRNLCIISLMLKTGLRVSEVINLKNEDIDWENGKIHISGSGAARERVLWIDQLELDLLERWKISKPQESLYFFSTLDGNKLQDRYIREMIKRLARKSGINKDVYPHLLRYTFAVDLMRETKDIHLLRESLGHRELSTTHAYTKLLIKETNEQYFTDISARRSGTLVRKEEQRSIPIQSISSGVRRPASKNSQTEQDNIAIPAIKCSNCNYILHYQGDCPKCRTSFAAILRHWGKDI